MAQIHPTAIVDEGAEIADSVVIGPYSYVGPNVKITLCLKVTQPLEKVISSFTMLL